MENDIPSLNDDKSTGDNGSISANLQVNLSVANAKHPTDKATNIFQPSNSSMDTSEDQENYTTVMWQNLHYTVKKKYFNLKGCVSCSSPLKLKKRTILKGLSGSFRTSQLTAIMGPSGSGKSTLLDCIVGLRKNNLSGSVTVVGSNQDYVKIAIISQTDYLIDMFTVKESLLYASRLKNYLNKIEDEQLEEVVSTISGNLNNVDSGSKNNLIKNKKTLTNYHQHLANAVISKLGLEVCADTQVGNCSGGQKKRISIALEMISK